MQQPLDYQHHYIDGTEINLPIGKVVCVGRNYAAHAHELNNPVPDSPVLFIKPNTSMCCFEKEIIIPKNLGACHYESEIAVLIGAALTHASEDQVQNAILGYGIGLDLTLRELQSDLKSQGYPWEKAKAFDNACPLTHFIKPDQIQNPDNIAWRCMINDDVKQVGNTQFMVTSMFKLIAYMSQFFSLLPGDVIMTGTPEGVGPLHVADEVILELDDIHRFVSCVI